MPAHILAAYILSFFDIRFWAKGGLLLKLFTGKIWFIVFLH